MNKFEFLEKELCKELEAIEQKMKGGAEMTPQDLERVDKLSHSIKSLMAYEKMREEAEEWDGFSGRRGRAMNGRYVSRDEGNSYADGYSRGYSEGMRQFSNYHPY